MYDIIKMLDTDPIASIDIWSCSNVETNYRKVLTQKGKMKLSNEEVDDLIKKVSPESLESGVINYRDIIEQFVSDYDQVNIINSNINNGDVDKQNTLDVPQIGE